MGEHRSHHRIKVIGGVEHFLCTDAHCEQPYKLREGFATRPEGQLGIQSRCRDCQRRIGRLKRAADRDKYNAEARRRASKKRIEDRKHRAKADREYAAVLQGESRTFVPLEDISPWIAQLEREHGEVRIISELTGLDPRRLLDLRKGRVTNVEFETADAIAVAAGRQAELAELVPVPGLVGWSRAGHTCCEQCGTFSHPHYGRGLCAQCYHRTIREEGHTKEVTRLPRDQRSWSNHFLRCRDCDKTDKPHRGRGLCSRCYTKRVKHGTLSEVPMIAPGKGQYKRKPRSRGATGLHVPVGEPTGDVERLAT